MSLAILLGILGRNYYLLVLPKFAPLPLKVPMILTGNFGSQLYFWELVWVAERARRNTEVRRMTPRGSVDREDELETARDELETERCSPAARPLPSKAIRPRPARYVETPIGTAWARASTKWTGAKAVRAHYRPPRSLHARSPASQRKSGKFKETGFGY